VTTACSPGVQFVTCSIRTRSSLELANYNPPALIEHVLQGIDRRERLRRLALETIDLAKDPYFMRNHLGQYECRLCLTLHTNEGNYLAHTQASSPSDLAPLRLPEMFEPAVSLESGPWVKHFSWMQGKRHQQNLAKRAAREARDKPIQPAPKTTVAPRKTVKIGKPGYRVTKLYDQAARQRHLLFQVL
jgi:splicing factor 3A subunit 2